jgi:hypothetical protein
VAAGQLLHVTQQITRLGKQKGPAIITRLFSFPPLSALIRRIDNPWCARTSRAGKEQTQSLLCSSISWEIKKKLP